MQTTDQPCDQCNGTGLDPHHPPSSKIDCRTCDGTGVDIAAKLNELVAQAQRGITHGVDLEQRIEHELLMLLRLQPDLRDKPEELALAKKAIEGLVRNNVEGTTAHALARPGDPYLVPRITPHAERMAELDEHALTTAFHEMAKFPLPPPPDSTLRQREAIGRAIAEYLTNAKRGEDADQVANRVVAALGCVEAHELANVLSQWALAIAYRAHKAEQMGVPR